MEHVAFVSWTQCGRNILRVPTRHEWGSTVPEKNSSPRRTYSHRRNARNTNVYVHTCRVWKVATWKRTIRRLGNQRRNRCDFPPCGSSCPRWQEDNASEHFSIVPNPKWRKWLMMDWRDQNVTLSECRRKSKVLRRLQCQVNNGHWASPKCKQKNWHR